LKITEEYHVLEGEKEQTEKKTKKSILETLDVFFTTHCLESIVESKKKTAGDTDLISIVKNMKLLLNMVTGIERIHHVIIENQISTLANRMKTIQGMLAQYFIMKNSDIKIDFVSSFNKLKGFSERIERSYEKTEKTEGPAQLSSDFNTKHWFNLPNTTPTCGTVTTSQSSMNHCIESPVVPPHPLTRPSCAHPPLCDKQQQAVSNLRSESCP
jgi:hypothetical protein